MAVYTARINHSEDTVKTMARAQYESFRPRSYYVMLCLSLALLAAALFIAGMGQGLKILCLAAGSFTLVSLDAPARQLGAQVVKSLKGKFPRMEYGFGEASVQLTGDTNVQSLGYNEIIRLYEDRDYFYLFIENRSAYMLDRSTVKPEQEGFKAFLQEKTGLNWTSRKSILNTSLKTLSRGGGDPGSRYRGPRL